MNFSATQHCNIVPKCNTMLQEKMLLQIILCNLTYRLKFIANISQSIQNFNIRPGKPRAFDHHLCQGSGKFEPRIVRVVTKISSCRVNTTSRGAGDTTARDFFWFYFPVKVAGGSPRPLPLNYSPALSILS